jgi:hypothetical protein
MSSPNALSFLAKVDELQRSQAGQHAVNVEIESFTKNQGRDLSGMVVTDFNLTAVDFSGYDFRGTTFAGCTLTNARFSACKLDGAKLVPSESRPTDAVSADFTHAKATNVKFACNLSGATFHKSDLTGATFGGSDLRATKFIECNLCGASLQQIRVDETTRFQRLYQTKGSTIGRYELACLGKDGGLTPGNLMDMEIVDDVAKLRSRFGGIWSIAHALALVVFLLPYVWFTGWLWVRAGFNGKDDAEKSVTILSALGRYIASGGKEWRDHWEVDGFAILLFLTVLAYNIARAALLFKTKQLETKQIVTGLPVNFSLSDSRWNSLYKVADWGFILATILIIWHTYQFMQTEVPL